MKALSIQQPWAWWIASGHKDVENRTWPTKFRGIFLIHASLKWDTAGSHWIEKNTGFELGHKDDFPKGGIVGQAELIDCVTEYNSPWFFGPYGFVIENARPLPFRPYIGRLGFFEVEK